jgi:hypothetical protein
MSVYMNFSDDLVKDHSYLVARGVRALALVGQCESDAWTMLQQATRLEMLAEPGAIPFVVDRGNGWADFGFAAAGWVLDLFSWVTKEPEDTMPDKQRHRILGLLLGYSTEAIRLFEEGRSGRLFTAVSPGSEPSSQLSCNPSTGETVLHS